MKRFLIQSMSLSVLALSTAGLLSVVLAPSSAEAKSAAGLDRAVDSTVDAFMQDHKGAKQLMDLAKGVLVFPNLVKGAVGIGGEFGEGALRVNGETVGYYNKVSLSAGFQLGGQAKSLLVFFFDDDELQDFRRSNGWQVGVDGAIVVLGYGANGELNTTNIKDPVVAVIIGSKGLMAGVSLEGSKFTRINKNAAKKSKK